MKKILLIIFFFFIASFNTAFCAIEVKSNGGTTVSANQVSTPIQMSVSNFLSATLTVQVKALDQYITSTTNENYRIPISQLYLIDSNKKEFQMVYNSDVTVASGIDISIGSYTQNYNCVIKDIGVLPPGTYITRLMFDAFTTLSSSSITYPLTFTIPLSQSVSSTTNPVNITLSQDNVFDGTATVDNTTNPQIVVQSNGKWKLVLNTTGIGTLPSNYYFLITGVSSHVSDYIQAQTKIEPNQQYVLASGNATITAPVTGTYTTDYVNIKYSLKNTSGTYIPEGTYNNNLNYIIQSGET